MTLRNMLAIDEEHECVFEPGDCDICSSCGEHTGFCESCGSECCGAWPPVLD